MEASSIPLSLVCLPPRRVSANPNHRPPRFSRSKRGVGHARAPPRIHAIDGAADLGPPVELTWQVAVAGITPFVVAGIEFGKRIVAQRKCGVCGGSGLVLRNDFYVRCPGCGGFLPWQSWKRFFTG
ncbi:uncharacterized protein LOC103698011 isoform X2 [Phoenix dactylifera]|uniref:Uncharacterized protein LOC103698011 isoform X2 n=1 Tax=Phoenix dactylifera TaxID=42345 RepID=A0A8B8ZJB6_PHODC|nr:uncharacterized protein LOC103698011 isoform X2 [Phoenix dactylifera]